MRCKMISVIIPSRNEKYLNQTILDLFQKAKTPLEVIVVLDGYWDPVPVDGVKYIHRGKAMGMRSAINSAASISTGDFIMKLDAHCMVDDGFDEKLIKDHHENWVQIPRRKRLDPHKWEIIKDGRPDVDYMLLDNDNRGRLDEKKNNDAALKNVLIDDVESFQGSCYFVRRDFFTGLGLLDADNFGEAGHEAQEITRAVVSSGGRVVVNKNTWYAHWHKTKKDLTFSMDRSKSRKHMSEIMTQENKAEIAEELPFANFSTAPNKINGFKRRHLIQEFNKLGFKRGAEIGVRTGKFSEVMCTSIKDLYLLSIDPYNLVFDDVRSHRIGQDGQDDFYREATKRLAPYANSDPDKGCRIVRKTSMEAAIDVPNESLDFVYIDGSHQFDYVMCDIIVWAQKVRKGGVVSGHDYYRARNMEVVDAVDMYCKIHKYDFYLTGENSASWFFVKK